MDKKTTVLIVGAGPTGLMMAAQLARFNVDFLIIEQHDKPSQKTKAIAVQARTMEIYDQMGLKDKVLGQSLKFTRAHIIGKTKIKVTIPIGDFGTGLSPFPYMTIFTQDRNEKVLNDFLASKNKKVEWNTSFTGLSEEKEHISVKVLNPDGSESVIQAKYVVAADGGRSPVRHFLKMGFEGATYEQIFFVADTAVDWKYGYGDLFLCFSENKLAAFFPMPGEKRFRVISIVSESLLEKEQITFEDIKPIFPQEMDIDVKFYDTTWFSEYRIHHRVINSFSRGRVFFAGDAAHIHSPAGGQGMNTGLQDAYNLAWKIACVDKYGASEKLPDTYNEERLPNAITLVKTTDRGFNTIVNANPFFRANILPLLANIAIHIPPLRKEIFRRISQISINYADFSLSEGRTSLHKAGERLPYVELMQKGKRVNIYELLTAPVFHVLICTPQSIPDAGLQSIMQEVVSIKEGAIKTVHIDAAQSEAFKKWGIKSNMLLVLRPDNYTGCIIKKLDVKEAKRWFGKHIFTNTLP